MGCRLGYRRRPPAIVKTHSYPALSRSGLRRCFNRRSFCSLFSYGRANGRAQSSWREIYGPRATIAVVILASSASAAQALHVSDFVSGVRQSPYFSAATFIENMRAMLPHGLLVVSLTRDASPRPSYG